jgi:hypothetical protein
MTPAVDASRLLALEIGADGWCLTHCPAVPGAGFKAASPSAAVAQAPGFWRAEVDWLAAQGLQPLQLAPELVLRAGQGVGDIGGGFVVAETVRTGVLAATGDSEAFLKAFGQPLTHLLVEQGLAQLAAGRRALLTLRESRPAVWLDERALPGKRTPREAMHHLADAELFYLVRLGADQHAARELWARLSGRGKSEMERLAETRDRLVQALASLPDDRRAMVTVHDPHAERWTPFKIMWRAIWHERYTTKLL